MNPQKILLDNVDQEGIFSDLDPTHAMELQARAIRCREATQRGYYSTNRKTDLAAIGFGRTQQNSVSQNNPTLIIPIHDITGAIINYQMRPNRPRIKNSKPVKYETPTGSRLCLDIPNSPDVRLSLTSSLTPLFITEGAFKVDAGCGLGLLTIGISGVDGWRGRNSVDGVTVLADWEHISLKGRDVFLVFDSDYRHNRHVYNALARFKRWLDSKGAKVKIINLPSADDGAKMGLDDFIADRMKKGLADHEMRQEIFNLALDELPPFQGATTVECPYRINNGGIEFIKETDSSMSVVPLTNFAVRIVKEVCLDDGAGSTRRIFTLQSDFNGETRQFDLSAAQFTGSMKWVVERVGLGAIVFPGREDHARVAIQLLSVQEEIERVTAYESTGWMQLEGQWLYLHSGGAIGTAGLDTDVSVLLPGELSRYSLPAPPEGEQLKRAVRASLSIADVICDTIAFPLVASIYRSVLGEPDFSLHIVGESGGGKSELTALAMQHFGKLFTAKKLPESWSSTANAIEAKAFTVKDALFAVDDFVPRGSSAEIQRLQDKAERLFRGQGNQQGRSRLFADGNLRPTKYPRGLVISTGEDVPRGQSLRARMLVQEVAKHYGENQIKWKELSRAQANAGQGLFAESMAAFVQWVATRFDALQTERRQLFLALRELATAENQHRRLPEIIANLTLGIGIFLRFSVEVGALTQEQAESILGQAWEAFGRAAQGQRRFLNESESTTLFRQMLGAAIAGGTAHVALEDGTAPLIELDETDIEPRSWGWRQDDNGHWRPQGQRVGWISCDGQNLYLEPDVAMSVARKLAVDVGENLAVSRSELFKRLFERKLLLEKDQKRETFLVRKTVESKRRGVLHTSAQTFLEAGYMSIKPDHPDHPIVSEANTTDIPPILTQAFLTPPTTRPTTANEEIDFESATPSAIDNESRSGRVNGHNLGDEDTQEKATNDNQIKGFENVVGLVGKKPLTPSPENQVTTQKSEPRRERVKL